jgi:hypothetical protein
MTPAEQVKFPAYIEWARELAQHVVEGVSMGYSVPDQSQINSVPESFFTDLLRWYDGGYRGDPPYISFKAVMAAAESAQKFYEQSIRSGKA